VTRIFVGDCVESMRSLPDASVQCCVTSPPYWGLRDYGCEGQLGLEQTPEEYLAGMVRVFREVRRVLRDAILCEFSPEYAALAEARIREDAPLLADVRVTP